MVRKSLCATFFVLASTLPNFAFGADVSSAEHFGVNAGASSVDASGCIFTNIFLFGGVDTAKTPGSTTSTQAVFVNISQFDTCTFVSSFYGGQSNDIVFAFNANLSAVTLTGPIKLCDASSTCSTFQIDIAWNASSDLNRTISSTHNFCGASCKNFSRGENLARTLSGSGSISNGAINFAAPSTGFASMFSFTVVKP
jgi:hypothetical protein